MSKTTYINNKSDMKQRPIGLVIKEIAAEKNLRVIKLAELSGKTRQTIYMTFGRSEMTNEEIEEWSKILGVDAEEITSRWKTTNFPMKEGEASYLLEHLASLEQQFREVNEQLRIQLAVKDKQIDGLQRTVDVLLGKSEDVMHLTAARVMPLYSESEAQA